MRCGKSTSVKGAVWHAIHGTVDTAVWELIVKRYPSVERTVVVEIALNIVEVYISPLPFSLIYRPEFL